MVVLTTKHPNLVAHKKTPSLFRKKVKQTERIVEQTAQKLPSAGQTLGILLPTVLFLQPSGVTDINSKPFLQLSSCVFLLTLSYCES